eukprot:gene28543-34455_t
MLNEQRIRGKSMAGRQPTMTSKNLMSDSCSTIGSSTSSRFYSRFIAYILRTEIGNKPGLPLYLNVYASHELSGNAMVIEKPCPWDSKVPGAVVHSVLISHTLYDEALLDSSFRLKYAATPYLEDDVPYHQHPIPSTDTASLYGYYVYMQLFDAIFRYLDMLHPTVPVDDTTVAIVKILKEFAGEEANEAKWFPKTIKPIDISHLL